MGGLEGAGLLDEQHATNSTISDGLGAEGGIVLLSHAASAYIHARRALCAQGTLRNDRYSLELFCEWAGPMALKAIRGRHVQDWLAANTQWAPSTTRHHLSRIKGFFAWVTENQLITTNPVINIRGPKQPRGIPRELDREEVHKVLQACPDKRSRAILSLMFYEGLRRVEVSRLQVGDVDRDVLSIVGKGGHQRVMPLSGESARALACYLGEWPAASGPVFRSYTTLRPLNIGTIGNLVTRIFYDSGVKDRPHDGRSGHAARHTMAGHMIDSGADIRTVSDALGHEHESTTSIYLRKRRTVAQIRPFLPTY